MQERARLSVELSPIVVIAALSVVALLVVSAWKTTSFMQGNKTTKEVGIVTAANETPKSVFNWQSAPEGTSTSTEEDPDGLANIGKNVAGALIGSYTALKDAGMYTPARGEAIAETIASDLRANISYTVYGTRDIQIDEKTSHSRMLAYRNDMRLALEPLFEDTRYELEVLGYYLETKDSRYLEELRQQAAFYGEAKKNVLGVIAPKDAVQYHLGVLNALSEFEAVLVRLPQHVNDPFASAALLRSFNDAEARMFFSFDALATYYREYPQT